PAAGDLDGAASKNDWGYVTSQQYLTNSFDIKPSSRANQDVGLDGMPSEKEVGHFEDFLNAINPGAREAIISDPSADDYQHYFDPAFNASNAQILERYKNYNGMDGNSPITTTTD